jgi:hypothetical protein
VISLVLLNVKSHLQDLKGVWAILWRSFVFLPYMLLAFLSVGGVWLSRWVLPIWIAFFLYLQEWRQAIIAFAFWLLAMWVYRCLRLARFFESPPSLL